MDKQQLNKLIESKFEKKLKEHEMEISVVAQKYASSDTPNSAQYARAYEEVTLTIVKESIQEILLEALEITQ